MLDDFGPVEADLETIIDEDPEESDHEKETIQTADDDIVSFSLARGALSEVCDVAAVMRELSNTESDLVKQFVSRRCSSSCDFGPKKTPCCMLFPVGGVSRIANNSPRTSPNHPYPQPHTQTLPPSHTLILT